MDFTEATQVLARAYPDVGAKLQSLQETLSDWNQTTKNEHLVMRQESFNQRFEAIAVLNSHLEQIRDFHLNALRQLNADAEKRIGILRESAKLKDNGVRQTNRDSRDRLLHEAGVLEGSSIVFYHSAESMREARLFSEALNVVTQGVAALTRGKFCAYCGKATESCTCR
jgi:hypothetical protein